MTAELDLLALRDDTPGCTDHIHLNNAGSSLMPARVIRAIKEHIDLEARVGGYEAAADQRAQISAAYQSVADLLHARPEQIAFADSATSAYAAALSSIPFAAGDVILTTTQDYVSNQIQFMSLQKRIGVRVIRAPDLESGEVDTVAMAALIDQYRPRLVSVTHVPTNSGLVQDVAAIGRACRAANVLYLVDACQSVGQMEVLPEAIGSDFLTATFRKFLRGPRGAGFLHVSDRVLERELHPLFVDLRGAEWSEPDEYCLAEGAARFETWEFAYSLVLGGGAASTYASSIGIHDICARIRRLAQRLRVGLAHIRGARVLDRGREVSGIVSVGLTSADPPSIAAALRARGIQVSAQQRPVALLDYDRKGLTSSLRFSPHCFNSEQEIDVTLDAVATLLS